ncbi:MAG TPA: hypothetical protein VHQ91_15130 [Geminicoccaceae bacterium]|jgi:hypothetical protein|nr:hypothetical protein [Geminicoccaceae bacterium]
MTNAITARLALATMTAALMLALTGSPSSAHDDWGLPLLGGLVGGYGLSTIMQRHSEAESRQNLPPPPNYAQPAPTFAQPVPNTVAPAPSAAATAARIEQQLNVLDDLAAKGYVTPSEYKARRQALLNQL